MSELRDQLQSALGSAYELDRELGGGGMSRVFLAREKALGRDIVIKVLHPDLASGVNADRFNREIQLAAQLQHPHIVSILAAGEMDGLPYLTMPYVAGRSLRERLGDTPQLPIDEAVDILRDVARALAYAHGRGVIHRDIKPDNVLLAQGSATVTDFGVAKAVSAARDVASPTLTTVGTSIGTPTYMAPEQSAGDPSTDHRADIYAWGVMAYEVLAGRPPFTHTTPHRLLAAHVSEAPDPVTDHRPDCPPALAALIMRCLAKDPDDRPQSAEELVRALGEVRTGPSGDQETLPAISMATRRTLWRALGVYAAAFVVVVALAQTAVTMIGLPGFVVPGAVIVMAFGLPVVLFTSFVSHGSRVARTMSVTTPGGGKAPRSTLTRLAVTAGPHVTWKRTAFGGAGAVGVFAAIVVGFMTLRAFGIGPFGSLLAKGVIASSDQILVADFESPASDSTLGGVVSEGVRDGLSQSHTVRVVEPSAVAAQLQIMQLPPNTPVIRSVAREVAQRVGAKGIVEGTVAPVGSTYILTVRLIGVAADNQIATFQQAAKDATDLIPAIDRATRRLRDRVGESLKLVQETPRLEQATTASLPALRLYTEGVRANLERNYTKGITSLEGAIALDSTFGMAYRLAAIVYGNAGLRPERADSLRQRAFEVRSRLPDVDRALVEAEYYRRGSHEDRAKAIAADQRALEIDPKNPSALNGLALLMVSRRQYAAAESLFKAGQVAHPENSFFWSNLVTTQLSEGETSEALATAADFQKHFPSNPTAPGISRTVWALLDHRDSAVAICGRMTTSRSDQVRSNGYSCLGELAMTSGRLAETVRVEQQWVQNERSRGQVIDDLAIWFGSVTLDSWYRGRTADVVRRLDSLVAHHPPFDQGTYLTLANAYALAGRADKARSALSQFDAADRDTAHIRLAAAARRNTLSEVEIAEGKPDAAIRDILASDTSYDGAPTPCAPCTQARLGRAYDLAGKPDQAIAAFEQYVTSMYQGRPGNVDPLYLAGSYKRLGELYEAKATGEKNPAAAKADREKAMSYDAKFIELWKDADPELQPKVQDAKRRLMVLQAAGKG